MIDECAAYLSAQCQNRDVSENTQLRCRWHLHRPCSRNERKAGLAETFLDGCWAVRARKFCIWIGGATLDRPRHRQASDIEIHISPTWLALSEKVVLCIFPCKIRPLLSAMALKWLPKACASASHIKSPIALLVSAFHLCQSCS